MDQLDLGVTRGIITAEQRDALRALTGAPSIDARVEARRGMNAVTIAYWVGGIAVLAAFGWFLVSRWTVLGAAGVLVVTLVYGALFAGAARILGNQGFRHAAAVTTALVVGMVPIAAWAVLSLTGLWELYPDAPRGFFQPINPVWDQLRWLPIDLVTILAALIALRRVRFGILALPIAAGIAATGVHVVAFFAEPDLAIALGGRISFLLGSILLAIGYALDVRRTNDDDEDYAIWFYLVGTVSIVASIGWFWGEHSNITAHAMLTAAAIFAVAALRLRRKLLLLISSAGFVAYLAYLAFDVFEKTLEFPVALATMGIIVILGAVWVQRRYPSLMNDAADRPREIPGAWVGLSGAIVIAIVLIATGIPEARERVAERYWLERYWRLRSHNAQKHRDRAPTPRVTFRPMR